jgi:prepilin-type processing-associated H-X9-DG protein
MAQSRQWDPVDRLPRTIMIDQHHEDLANYVFADAHAKSQRWSDTFRQEPGSPPERDWWDPMTESK